ncbi:MAG: M23 family metallopeptidase [Tidjanibacter sp.]|nr:M23 family metallopeptidase [Tidjanibacter sp.]
MKRVVVAFVMLVCSLSLGAQSVVVSSPQTDALYRLPFDKGVKCVAYSLTPVSMGLGHSHNLVQFCAWELVASEPTGVVAPRDGVVESVMERDVLIRHEEGIYTYLQGIDGIVVKEGDKVAKGDVVAAPAENVRVRMEVFYLTPNPKYGDESVLSGKSKTLRHYINPIFSTRSKCKVQLTDGNSYTTKARTWCWPWE